MNDEREQNLNWYIQKILDGGINIKGIDSLTDQVSLSGLGLIKKLIWLNTGAIKVPGANAATWEDLGITGVWQFANSLTRHVVAGCRAPKSIKVGEDITIKVKWSSPSTTGVCRWQLEYLFCKEDDDVSANGTALGFEDDAPSAQADGLTITTFTVPHTHEGACCDEILFLNLARIGGSDTLGDVANLSGMTFIYICDMFFSSYVL